MFTLYIYRKDMNITLAGFLLMLKAKIQEISKTNITITHPW
jgi:hypothetical protein